MYITIFFNGFVWFWPIGHFCVSFLSSILVTLFNLIIKCGEQSSIFYCIELETLYSFENSFLLIMSSVY